MALKYSIIDGSLPNGVTLDSNTGYLRGIPDYSNIELGPKWVTPSGSLGVFDALSTVSIPALDVVAQGDATSIVSVNLVLRDSDQGIPWGLSFDPSTWIISGTLAEQKSNEASSQFTEDQLPVWVTPSGELEVAGELDVIDITLSVTPEEGNIIESYFIKEGSLPWGLSLLPTGKITGTVSELKVSSISDYECPTPIPVWNTPMGLLGTILVGTASNFSVSAVPKLGTQLVYSIKEGSLPWGLSLLADGSITGAAAELKSFEPPVTHDPPKWPDSPTNIGTFSLKDSPQVSYVVTPPTPTTGSEIVSLFCNNMEKLLPWGLSLTNGKISGTLSITNSIDSYICSISAIDTNGSISSHDFQITITV